jgi:hypothetical protein
MPKIPKIHEPKLNPQNLFIFDNYLSSQSNIKICLLCRWQQNDCFQPSQKFPQRHTFNFYYT